MWGSAVDTERRITQLERQVKALTVALFAGTVVVAGAWQAKSQQREVLRVRQSLLLIEFALDRCLSRTFGSASMRLEVMRRVWGEAARQRDEADEGRLEK